MMSTIEWFVLLIAIIVIILALITYFNKPSPLRRVSERRNSNESEVTNSNESLKQKNTDVVPKKENSNLPSARVSREIPPEKLTPDSNKAPGLEKPSEIQSDKDNSNKSETTNSNEPSNEKDVANTSKEHSDDSSLDANPDEPPEIINPEQNENTSPIIPAEIEEDKEEEKTLPEKNVDDINDKTKRKQKLREALKNNLPLESEYEMIATKMEGDKDAVFMKKFTDDDMEMKVNEASLFGIALLNKYASDNTLTKYLQIVEFLINHIDKKLAKEKFNNYQTTIWGFGWHDISVLFARMLSMYEILGEIEAVLEICRRRLNDMGPKLGKETGSTPEGVDLVHVMIPRLITDYINDFDSYTAVIETGIFTRFRNVFDVTAKIDDDGEDGLYRDGSNVRHKVATFSNLAKLGSFYVNIYRAMDDSPKIDDVVVKLFDKILHPDMDFVPYGLFGREPKITCKDILKYYWPEYRKEAKLGAIIFPYIGLGVFKSPKFIFALRVQREDIAAYESDPDNFEFAAGWIQMRKLYLTDVDYSKYENVMKWPELKLQPGVISFVDDKYNKFDNLKPATGSLAHLCQGVRSYIGHLTDDNKNLLFWINNYKFDKIYGDSEVMEYGICTDNGLVMHYSVYNKLADRELKLRVKDDDIKSDSQMYIETVPDLDENGCFTSRTRGTYRWRQVFDTNVEPTRIFIDSLYRISFMFNKKRFEILLSDDKYYYTIKRGLDIILAGSSHSDPNDRYELNGKNFIRNPNTMMYE
ncbi:putative envelope protein ODV-E66-10, partial [Microplitis demolitor]